MKKPGLIMFSFATIFSLVACGTNTKDNKKIHLENPSDTSQCTANCKAYIDAMRAQHEEIENDYVLNDLKGAQGVDIRNYDDVEPGPYSDVSTGVDLKFNVDEGFSADKYTVKLSLNSDMSDAKEFEVEEDNKVNVNNLLVNTTYYWQVSAGDEVSDVANFTTGDYPRWISAQPLFNVRDNGGYMTSFGRRIKQGLVFRGGEITTKEFTRGGEKHIQTVSEESKDIFKNVMKIGVELDLRSSTENEGNYTSCGFADDGDIDYLLCDAGSYENYINNPKKIVDIFNAFAHADEKPVYYHCYGGADRTGTVGFLLGAILGMSYTDLVIDFELTSYSSIQTRERKRSHLRREGNWDRWDALIDALKGQRNWLDEDPLTDNVERYLNSKGVTSEVIEQIRDVMLEPAE